MAANAYQTLYIEEFIQAFSKTKSRLRDTVFNKIMIKGNQAIFLVFDESGESYNTRGSTGLLTATPLNQTQNTCTLLPKYKKYTINDFDEFASQGDVRQMMYEAVSSVLNRAIDEEVQTALATGSVTIGTSGVTHADTELIARITTILGNANANVNGEAEITGLVTPAFANYLAQTTEFGNQLYNSRRMLPNNDMGLMQGYMPFTYWGINWVVDANLPNTGLVNEQCYFYNKRAIGHAMNSKDITFRTGENDEDLFFYAVGRIFTGAKLLQNSGVVKVTHDGSLLAA